MRIHLFSAIIHSKINKFRNEPFSILVTRPFYDIALNLSIGPQMFYRITFGRTLFLVNLHVL